MGRTGMEKEKSKSKKADSVQRKIQLSSILMVTVSMLTLGIVSSVLNFTTTYATLKQSLSEMSSIAAGRVEWEMTAYKNIVAEIGSTARLSNADYSIQQKQELIDQKVKSYGFVRGKLIGTDGIAQIDGTDYNDREYFKIAMSGGVYMSEPLIAKTDGAISLIAAAPVWEGGVPGNEIVGVVFVVLPADTLNEIMRDIHLSPNCGAFALNSKGVTIAHVDGSLVEAQDNIIEKSKTDKSLESMAKLEKEMIAGKDGFGIYTYKGVSKFLSYSPISNTSGWSMAVNAPIMDFFGNTVVGILITLILMIVSILLASYIATRTGKKIGEPIRLCTERLEKIAAGDLHSEVPEVASKDETGVLAQTTKNIVRELNAMIGDIKYILQCMAEGDFTVKSQARSSYVGDFKAIIESLSSIKWALSGTLSSIRSASEQVSAGSIQMAEGAQSLAEGATDQAGAVEELLATVADTAGKVIENAKVATDTSRQAKIIGENAQESTQKMHDMTAAMGRISDASNEIGNIIKSIEGIASQTNLLSVNAAIEAARAGESGRGFAVVADEISQLSKQSAAAARETRKLIETSSNEVGKGNEIVENTAQVLEAVIGGIAQIVSQIEDVANSSSQQAEAIQQINLGIEQISTVVETNSATAEESSATSEELSAQAEQLKTEVGRFRIDDKK